MKKVGIMGGTFNPIHNAHLILAEQAYHQFDLEKVLFMPTKNPPHKKKQELASDEHRKNMIHEAIKENPHFELSTLEMEREGITYTAETLRILHQMGEDTEYYFILGGDSLMQITSWREPKAIFSMAKIVAATRTGYREDEIIRQCNRLEQEYHAAIMRLDVPNLEISSKLIRTRCEQEEPIRYYVPETVFSYIQEHKLYV